MLNSEELFGALTNNTFVGISEDSELAMSTGSRGQTIGHFPLVLSVPVPAYGKSVLCKDI